MCNIDVLNIYAAMVEKIGDSKDRFYEELEEVFVIIFVITVWKFY